jgi:hypothetical protein
LVEESFQFLNQQNVGIGITDNLGLNARPAIIRAIKASK